MNANQQTLLGLIKKSQFGVETSPSPNTNWDEVFYEASLQSVLGIVAPVVPDNLKAEEKWQQAEYRQLATYVRYSFAEKQMVELLDSEGIPFVILKGNSAAVYYKNPSERTMGDIDFQVLPEDFERTKTLLINSEYKVVSEKDETSRHIEFKKNGCSFELHRRFSHKEVDIEDYLIEGIKKREMVKIDDHNIPMLPSISNGLVLLDHMRNHLKSGLGLRQVIDWMMFVNSVVNDRFWNEGFGNIAKQKRMDILAITTTKMCKLYLGLKDEISWCDTADRSLCDLLLENLMASGNFGKKNGNGVLIEQISTKMRSEGRFRWLQRMGEHNWEAYHKHHWLKPFCWIYQGFRYAKKGLRTGRSRKQLSDDLNRSEKRYELLKRLGIE